MEVVSSQPDSLPTLSAAKITGLPTVGLATDTVGSQNFQTFSTRQTPQLGD